MEKDDSFKYTYSSPTESERKEISDIRSKYEEKENGLDELRRLDMLVNRRPMIVSLSLGIVGTLIFGLGMSMVLEFDLLLWGILVSFIGLVVAVIAYPIYNRIYSKNKEKYKDRILELSKNLLNEK